jgi:hypothetical protein
MLFWFVMPGSLVGGHQQELITFTFRVEEQYLGDLCKSQNSSFCIVLNCMRFDVFTAVKMRLTLNNLIGGYQLLWRNILPPPPG